MPLHIKIAPKNTESLSSGSTRKLDSRVVLFGGEGFVGTSLRRFFTFPLVAPPQTEVDLTRPESLRGVIQAGDVVINAAGYANATDTTEHGRALFQAVNVDGLRYLATSAAEAGAAHFIHVSSVAAMGRVYGEGITEDKMVPVRSPYALSKLEGEKLLINFAEKLPVTILRPTSVFGEGRGLAMILCRVIAKGIVPLPGGGKALIPFTYVGNLASAVELSLGNSNCFGKTFIVGDECSHSLREIVLSLAQSLEVEPRILPVPRLAAYTGVRFLELLARLQGSSPILDRGRLDTLTESVSYSIAAFQEATGYIPRYSLQEAADRIAAWYRSVNQSVSSEK